MNQNNARAIFKNMPVPPQNPVNRTIVDVSTLGVKLTYPHASLAVRPARDRQQRQLGVCGTGGSPETEADVHRSTGRSGRSSVESPVRTRLGERLAFTVSCSSSASTSDKPRWRVPCRVGESRPRRPGV